MRVLMSGIAAAVILAVIAAFGLSVVQTPAYDRYSSSSTRLGDPGSNLVGNIWGERGGHTESASGSASK